MARDTFEAMRLPDEPVDPSPEFAASLKRRIQSHRRPRSDHERHRLETEQRVLPYLMVADARAAIDFYCEVFGAERVGDPIVMDDGASATRSCASVHRRVYLADEFPEMGYSVR